MKKRIFQICITSIIILTKTTSCENHARFCRTLENEPSVRNISKRSVEPIFKGNPKNREDIWNDRFLRNSAIFDQTPSLINLLNLIGSKYLYKCTPIILYDTFVENSDGLLLEQLFRHFPISYIHGRIGENYKIENKNLFQIATTSCISYVLFLADVMKTHYVIGSQPVNKVVVVARSSQWRVQEFLQDESARSLVNLLVIGQTLKDDDNTLEAPYVLYTHRLYVDGIGSSAPQVITSWIRGHLARPTQNLFPVKLSEGFSGHRFIVSAANQPPFVFRRQSLDPSGQAVIYWDGVEYRIMKLIGEMLNFTSDIREPVNLKLGPGDAVAKEVAAGKADFGIGGVYVTNERIKQMEMSSIHSQDCASFITLSSTALPRYRAIMGPFHWSVWVALTFTYLFGIFPLAFSDRHSLNHLLKKPGEMENMFWYMFGTFTNSLTFTGVDSWSGSEKIATRLLIGSYWLFTIIITSCYTGSIIAFVTLPMFPETVDTVNQLINGYYRVGTLDRGGWEKWFENSSDVNTNRLLKNIELLPNIESGLLNTTRAFFWPYAFLGSHAQLEYIVQANFSSDNANKRSALHISKECFVPFGVSFAIPRNAIYTTKINKAIQWSQQSGLIKKLTNEVSWEMQRTSTGKLLQAETGKSLRIASVEERGLTLADTQGMFLLLGAGFLIAAGSLVSEWMGGCCKKCKKPKQNSRNSISSMGEKSFHIPTPKLRKNKKTEYDHFNNESSVCSYVSDDNNLVLQKTHHRRASSNSFMFSKKHEIISTPIRRFSYCVNGEQIPVYLKSNRKLSVHSNVVQIHNAISKEPDLDGVKLKNTVELDENKWNECRGDIEDIFGDKVVHDSNSY